MKKIIFALLIMIQAAAFSQDAFTTIGKLKLRYDADSNYLRIGYTNTLTGISTLRIGKEVNSQLFDFNTSQFTWSTSTGLNLNNNVFQQDSISAKILSPFKDTSWVVLGETITKRKFLSIKKPFFNSSVNAYLDWKYYYRSFDTDGSLLAFDSAYVVNNILEIDQVENVTLSYDGALTKIDSLALDAGTYNITFSFVFERTNPDDIAAVGEIDTVEIALKEEFSAPKVYIKKGIYNIHMYPASKSMNGGVLTWSTLYTASVDKRHVYIYGRYFANELAAALGVGITCKVIRASIVATLLR